MLHVTTKIIIINNPQKKISVVHLVLVFAMNSSIVTATVFTVICSNISFRELDASLFRKLKSNSNTKQAFEQCTL